METINNLQEIELINEIESGEWKSSGNLKFKIEKFQNIAKEQLAKEQRINIRLYESDLKKLQLLAFDEGLPYQTFIRSILHKYVNGKIVNL
jgi:predicted DNA binding CopG/RHH family protein